MTERWFSYDPEDGFETHATEADARKRAMESIDYAHEDGWGEHVTGICWGEIKEEAFECGPREPAPDGSEFDEITDYKLRPLPEEPSA